MRKLKLTKVDVLKQKRCELFDKIYFDLIYSFNVWVAQFLGNKYTTETDFNVK